MAAVNEWMVREYFELQGFLVSQPQKHKPASLRKDNGENADLLAINPTVKELTLPKQMVWTTEDLKGVSRAIIGVRGWHTDRFSPSVLRKAPEIFQFAGPKAVDRFSRSLGGGPVARILCLSGLPASSLLRNDTLDLLKEKGIDGVLLFHTILMDLLQHVNVKRNYEKSDLLQILRVLKNYDLLRDDQLELFSRQRKSRKRSPKPV